MQKDRRACTKEVHQVMNCREARRLEQRNLDEGDKESARMGVPGQGELKEAADECCRPTRGERAMGREGGVTA